MAEPALGAVHGRHLLPQLCREGATHKILLHSERIVKDTPCERLRGFAPRSHRTPGVLKMTWDTDAVRFSQKVMGSS